MKNTIIESKRFYLKSLTKDNITTNYVGWLNNPAGNEFINYAKKYHSFSELRDYVNEKAIDENVLFLGIFDKEKNIHIGNIKYEPIDFFKFSAIMGILIGEEKYRGIGVASEVIETSARWLYENHKINTIELCVDCANVNAIKAYEKCGFFLSDKANSDPTIKWFKMNADI